MPTHEKRRPGALGPPFLFTRPDITRSPDTVYPFQHDFGRQSDILISDVPATGIRQDEFREPGLRPREARPRQPPAVMRIGDAVQTFRREIFEERNPIPADQLARGRPVDDCRGEHLFPGR